jgi:LytS/YehU family sensor histidine kinase
VRIEVEDDGPGFDASLSPEGHGLALVRERLTMALGDRASLHIDAVPGRSRIAIEIPGAAPAARDDRSSASSPSRPSPPELPPSAR